VLFVTFVFINSPLAFLTLRAIRVISGFSLRPGTIRRARMIRLRVSISFLSWLSIYIRVSSVSGTAAQRWSRGCCWFFGDEIARCMT
jgi:hypothetical protein